MARPNKYIIEEITSELNELGVTPVRVRQSPLVWEIIYITFKSQEDMHLYQVAAQKREGFILTCRVDVPYDR